MQVLNARPPVDASSRAATGVPAEAVPASWEDDGAADTLLAAAAAVSRTTSEAAHGSSLASACVELPGDDLLISAPVLILHTERFCEGVPVDTPGTFPVNETVVAGVIGCRVPAVTREACAAREERTIAIK